MAIIHNVRGGTVGLNEEERLMIARLLVKKRDIRHMAMMDKKCITVLHGCRCRNHTRRNNEDNNIHHYRLHALCCLELMHSRSKCR